MTVQDYNVLVNLAERCRQNGLIKFEEFAIVADALQHAVEKINELKDQAVEVKPESTKKTKS